MNKPTLRIFISSPGDVLYERQIAKRVIAKLGKEFAASAQLEALMWEDMPLQVTSSFQEGIDQITSAHIVDIAVFILWSRLGTPLSEKFIKSDGSLYKSGTEYEFEMMYAANQRSGSPSLLAYIKNAPIADAIFQSSTNADFDFEEIGKQHKEAQKFIREKFYDPKTKTVYGAYHQFDAATSFEQKLAEHLRRLIINKIGHEALPIEWEGNPYVGLRSFQYNENAIFYGRRLTINMIEEKLSHFLPDKAPCLFVLGESGSGKSSLVRAGLLPDIIEFGWIENTLWKWFDIMPHQFRGSVYQGIVSKLIEAFPFLKEKAIGQDLITGKEIHFGHLSDLLPNNREESVLIFMDQFEEIFTDPLVTEEERLRTFALLKGIASTQKVWMIFSMRNDFYHKFTSYPNLAELKSYSILFDLPKILHSELQEIVEEPAKKAGLKWETNRQGIPLNRAIIHDISAGVDDLPLIEFALSELYALRNENNVLTYQAYQEIGKIGGAVIQYVERLYNALSDKEKDIFYHLLSTLVAPSLENKNLYLRKTALLADVQKTEEHSHLLKKLIDSHILISGKDQNQEATVSIVHEILISSWSVIQEWIKQEKYFIDSNNHYENLSKYWLQHNQSKQDLLQGRVAHKEAEYFLFSWEKNCSGGVRSYLFSSIKKEKRTLLPTVLLCLLGCATALIAWIAGGKVDGISTLFLAAIFFGYLSWKKIKALPTYYTINISIAVWGIMWVLSLLFVMIHHQVQLYILSGLILIKLGATVLQKREMLLWKQRIFSRDANYFSVFLQNSSLWAQKAIKTIVWTTAAVLMVIVGLGVIYFIQIKKKEEYIQRTYEIVDELFERLHSTPLTPKERLFFYKKYLELTSIRTNFELNKEEEEEGIVSYHFGQEFSTSEYAMAQYHIGHPEGFLELIKGTKRSKYPIAEIKAAFALGLYEDCLRLILAFKKSHSEELFDQNLLWIEKELMTERLQRFAYTDDATQNDLIEPFLGVWTFEENESRTKWEISKENHNLSFYLIQNKENQQWIDQESHFTRYRMVASENKTVLEEYNPQSNVITQKEVWIDNNNNMCVQEINGMESTIIIFKR